MSEPESCWSSSNSMETKLPDFDDPPVVEVALAVQFEPLTALRTPHLGLLWGKFRDKFPRIEEHAPLDPMMERFGVMGPPRVGVRLEMMQNPPVPRCWFLNEAETELIQVQHDRFAHNWRKAGPKVEYVRYGSIRAKFRTELDQFAEFVTEENAGTLQPNQCELTYVNHIVSGQGWKHHSELGNVLTLFQAKYTDEFRPDLEDARVSGAYVVPDAAGQPLGRLRFSMEPAYRRADHMPILVLNLVARGRPDGEGIDGVMKFLDTGHDWIVRGFASMTTPQMHKIWGRTR